MTETSEKQTVQCPIHKREFPLATCLARQKIIATKPTSGLKGEAYDRYKLSCGVCEIGHELYSKSLKNAEITPIQNELVQVPSPTQENSLKPPKIESCEKQNPESKLCPCGKEFSRQQDQNDVSWAVSKYCPECAGLTVYYRKKKFASMGVEKHDKNYSSIIEPSHDDEDFKICAWPQCSQRFVKKPSESIHAFVARKYCCDECAKAADRERDNARKRRERAHRTKAMVFDCDMAKKIAEKLVNENSDVFEVVTDNGAQNLLIKKIITNICIDAQRASHDALWGDI